MSDTTVWQLAETTGQPLEVVIFQAVAYEAWNPGGRIDGEWAATLTAVLRGSHPWRRASTHRTTKAEDVVEPAQPRLEGTAPGPAAAFAAVVLTHLGQRVPSSDHSLAERLANLGLGEIEAGEFRGYPDEAPTWSQLAGGTLSLEALEKQ